MERGQLIAELEATKSELEEAQQRETELTVLRARERLARDLHDSLGHALVAIGTVKNHVSNILGKLQAENRTQAADIARRRGLI